MKLKVDAKGLRELQSQLDELPKATSRNVLARAGIKAMRRIETRAKELAPVDDGQLRNSITTQKAKAQRVSATRFAQGVTIETGPTGKRPAGGNAAWQEFGTVKMAANPFMRPAADGEGPAVMADLKQELAAEILKAAARIARKSAKGG